MAGEVAEGEATLAPGSEGTVPSYCTEKYHPQGLWVPWQNGESVISKTNSTPLFYNYYTVLALIIRMAKNNY